MWRARFDARGHEIEISFFGADGGPCPHMLGVATQTGKYDERGNQIEQVNLGLDGKPCLNKVHNYSWWQAKFDERGNTIQKSYFGVDGNPCLNKEGHAGFAEERDELGNLVKCVYVDVEGRTMRTVGSPIMMDKNGVVGVAAEPGSASAQKGIQLGDVLLEFGPWRFFPQRNFGRSVAELRLVMDKSKPREKRLVLFRPGSVGLNILDTLWHGEELKEIREAYEKFIREKEAAGKDQR